MRLPAPRAASPRRSLGRPQESPAHSRDAPLLGHLVVPLRILRAAADGVFPVPGDAAAYQVTDARQTQAGEGFGAHLALLLERVIEQRRELRLVEENLDAQPYVADHVALLHASHLPSLLV